MNTDCKENVFYLKVNRVEGYTLRNLRHWLRIVDAYGINTFYYIICDNENLKKRILDEFSHEYPDMEKRFLQSRFDEELKYITDRVTDQRWEKAGYAHLTTFMHAKELGHVRFWNIDADDTRFCLSADRCKQLLIAAEDYAIENNIDCFSLDMHTSIIGSGRHWSFGITYTNNQVDWLNLMTQHCGDDLSVEDPCCNVDRYFRYIRNNVPDVRVESFYVENLKFFHYSNDFFWRVYESALFHWKDGYLTLPLLYYGIGLRNKKSHMPIDSIVVKLDIQISDEESMISMLNACNTPTVYLRSLKDED